MVEFLESENTWAQPDSKRKSKHSQTFGLAASSTSRNSTSHRWEYLETTSSVLKVYKHFPEYCSPKQYSLTFHETRYDHSLEMTSVEGRLSTGHWEGCSLEFHTGLSGHGCWESWALSLYEMRLNLHQKEMGRTLLRKSHTDQIAPRPRRAECALHIRLSIDCF